VCRGELRHLAVFEEDHVAGVAEQRSDVAAAQHFAFPDADDEGRRRLRDDQTIGCAPRHHGDRVRSFDLFDGDPYGVEKVLRASGDGPVDEVRDDLGVRVGREAHAIGLERLSERHVILDDAVVHDGDVACRVRVGIVFARTSVRGPARMTDAGRAGEGSFRESFVQERELAGSANDFDGLAVMDC
jgi:hypothetical protein